MKEFSIHAIKSKSGLGFIVRADGNSPSVRAVFTGREVSGKLPDAINTKHSETPTPPIDKDQAQLNQPVAIWSSVCESTKWRLRSGDSNRVSICFF